MRNFPAYLLWNGSGVKPDELPQVITLEKPTVIVGRGKDVDV